MDVNDEVLKPRSITMPDGRDIKSIEYKMDIFAYNQKREQESFVLKILKSIEGKMEAQNHE